MSDVDLEPKGGPWSPVVDVLLCLTPLVFLVVVTLSARLRIPTVTSLPVAAVMMWFIRLAYLSSPANEVHAAVIVGVLDALTPLTIIAGAICLFSTMQHTMCLPWIIQKIKHLSQGHPVAEVFLIGWAFAYLIEGASGFGTPVALAAPMLKELGHPAFNAVVCLLIMNTLATPYGAVGTPIWFGFSGLGLTQDDLVTVGFKVSVLDGIVSHIVPLLAASFLVSWRDLWNSKVFVLLSIWSCVLPAVALSYFSSEFSSILGGLVGVGITALLAQHRFGLHAYTDERQYMSHDEETGLVAIEEHSEHTKSMPQITTRTPPASVPTSESSLAPSDNTQGNLGVRRASIQVATLYMEPHLQRQDSVESTPGEFVHMPMVKDKQGNKVKNRVIFPITYAPLNFPSKKRSRGTQTGLDESEIALLEQSPSFAQYDTVSLESGTRQSSHTASQPRGVQSMTNMMVDTSDQYIDTFGSTSSPFLNGLGRTFPLWGTVVLLILTRVPQLGIKPELQRNEPAFKIQFGSLAKFELSAALVVTLSDVLGEDVTWSFQMLYVPFILPFVFVSLITVWMYKRDIHPGLSWTTPFQETLVRVKNIVVALVGALVLVSLIRKGGNGSPAFIIGSNSAEALKDAFIIFSPIVGTLGSFFSGSTTVSNLTFGTVQRVAANKMGRSITSLLALQCMGATLGNMVCINNIISAKTVLGLDEGEGDFIKKTAPIAFVFYVVGTIAGLMFVL